MSIKEKFQKITDLVNEKGEIILNFSYNVILFQKLYYNETYQQVFFETTDIEEREHLEYPLTDYKVFMIDILYNNLFYIN